MGYLVCDDCGGYYELQQGESVDIFKCSCGGNLRYVDSLYGGPKKRYPFMDKFFSNKILIIGLIIFLIASFVFLASIFTPNNIKLDDSIPDNAGAFHVPKYSSQINQQTGLNWQYPETTDYDGDSSIKFLNKVFIRENSPFLITVGMAYYSDSSQDEVESIYNTTLYGPVEKININGIEVDAMDFSPYYLFSWHGNQYSVAVFVRSSSHYATPEHRNEGLTFLHQFIPEFKKSNRYN